MNNNPKNDIAEEYQLFPLSDVDNRSKRRNMLIRHDYYSADSAHGRSLLESVFEAIEDSDLVSIQFLPAVRNQIRCQYILLQFVDLDLFHTFERTVN